MPFLETPLAKVGLGVAAIALLLGLLELGLRSQFGFGKPLTYVADPQVGYLLAPNQTTCRMGKRIVINQYSMRNSDISLERPEHTLRILLIGDSIANGGTWTDQSETISALLQLQLQEISGFDRVEVLNASANSWSPRNELAYLQRFGTFDAQAIVQLINTDDLFGIAPYSLVVGRDRNYPARLPAFAIAEAVSYLTQPQPIPDLDKLWQAGGDRVGENLAAIDQMQAIAVQNKADFLLVVTPLLREIGEPDSRNYEKTARQRLTDFAQQQQIPLIDFLPIFNADSRTKTFYQDSIHFNQAGNLQIVEKVSKRIVAERPQGEG